VTASGILESAIGQLVALAVVAVAYAVVHVVNSLRELRDLVVERRIRERLNLPR
jgi:hypothetical protein